jgi:LysM repeat protein
MRIISRLIVFVVVLAMSIMVVAAPVSAAPNAQFPNPLGTHTVKQGEWIYCIARAYKVSPWSIASVNHIPWPYWVYPNQVLTIPADPWYNIPAGQTCAAQFQTGWLAATAADSGTHYSSADAWSIPTPVPGYCRYYHYVLWGQTLSGIAWYYGTTIQAIMSVNPGITNPNLIYAGSTLCIP